MTQAVLLASCLLFPLLFTRCGEHLLPFQVTNNFFDFRPAVYPNHPVGFGIIISVMRSRHEDFDIISALKIVHAVIDEDIPAYQLLVPRNDYLPP